MKISSRSFLIAFIFATMIAGYSVARATDSQKCESAGETLILKNQTFDLCASASCLKFNQVAYCGCYIMKGDSISLSFDFDHGQDICTVSRQGGRNGYRVSTFRVPDVIKYPDSDYAQHTCPGEDCQAPGNRSTF